MEAKCASIWNEESEMIAHLQSVFWNSSDADASLSSPNSSTSSCIEPSTLPTALFLPLIGRESYDTAPFRNTAADWCFDHQSQAFAPIANAVTGDKRAVRIDDGRKKSTNSNKKARIVAPVLRTLSSSALDDEANNELINHSSSEDDSIGMCEESVVMKQRSSSRGRSRSSKNSQSVYAKKRRERINEKLKTLQQLIPNGTKVDMSTMLEEAVQYVKFLQLQIKLLSSDETWMYAPLAYNHMTIDINMNSSVKQ
ncbi:hypothetical protein SEVIR_8G213400v4 [Setaria viridis]|uniref:BHLH domain-containing protein n=1 Tax=Setaria viridis TaxID=4556 RepID=A0A4U6TL68_SETVI|nr:transcription factor bHLH139-like [Setaria viridis]TKW01963.1 hypothetical protein SEVIR_8G213400v2 [Setaria viridis]TKW01964.1 hypothetical protein SEVIR_8G213400v2 [Setaria viridis]